MHNHSKTHNTIVRNILRRIAHQIHKPYPQVRRRFVIYGDIEITTQFWQLLKENYPTHKFTEVSCCPDCGKFSLA